MNKKSALRSESVNAWAILLMSCLTLSVLHPAQTFAGNKNNSPAGTVTTWGEGSFQARPVLFPEGVIPISVSAYEYAGGLAISQDARLFEWFANDLGGSEVLFPAPVTQVKAVSRRFSHTLALTDDGLYAWGGNSKGQLGDGTTVDRWVPGKVQFPPGVTVLGIAAGYSHSLAITDDGLYAWGDNFNGELGDGTRLNRSLPVKVALPATVTSVIQVAAGRNTSYALPTMDFTRGGAISVASWATVLSGPCRTAPRMPVRPCQSAFSSTRKCRLF